MKYEVHHKQGVHTHIFKYVSQVRVLSNPFASGKNEIAKRDMCVFELILNNIYLKYVHEMCCCCCPNE